MEFSIGPNKDPYTNYLLVQKYKTFFKIAFVYQQVRNEVFLKFLCISEITIFERSVALSWSASF